MVAYCQTPEYSGEEIRSAPRLPCSGKGRVSRLRRRVTIANKKLAEWLPSNNTISELTRRESEP